VLAIRDAVTSFHYDVFYAPGVFPLGLSNPHVAGRVNMLARKLLPLPAACRSPGLLAECQQFLDNQSELRPLRDSSPIEIFRGDATEVHKFARNKTHEAILTSDGVLHADRQSYDLVRGKYDRKGNALRFWKGGKKVRTFTFDRIEELETVMTSRIELRVRHYIGLLGRTPFLAPSLILPLSILTCDCVDDGIARAIFCTFLSENKLEFFLRSLTLAAASCRTEAGLFKQETIFTRALRALFIGAGHKWLREFAANAVSNQVNDPAMLLNLVYTSFRAIPAEALYIIRSVLVLTAATSPSDRSVFIPFFTFLHTAIQSSVTQYSSPHLEIFSSLFTDLEVQISQFELTGNDPLLKLGPFISRILGRVPQLRYDVAQKSVWREEIDGFIHAHPDVLLEKVESFLEDRSPEHPIVYSYYQNFRFLLRAQIPELPV
jgi:hypothetical protein